VSDLFARDDLSGPRQLGFVESFLSSYVQDSGMARGAEGALAMVRELGSFGGVPEPGYNPYRDPTVMDFLRENPGSSRLFWRSQSQGESAVIRDLTARRIQRSQELQQGGDGVAQFLAGMLAPESLITLPLGIGTLTAATRVGRMAQAAGRSAVLGGAIEGGIAAVGQVGLPEGMEPSIPEAMMYGALFSGALGGFAGMFSRRSLEAAPGGVSAPGASRVDPSAPAAASGRSFEVDPLPQRVDGGALPAANDTQRWIPWRSEGEMQPLSQRVAGDARTDFANDDRLLVGYSDGDQEMRLAEDGRIVDEYGQSINLDLIPDSVKLERMAGKLPPDLAGRGNMLRSAIGETTNDQDEAVRQLVEAGRASETLRQLREDAAAGDELAARIVRNHDRLEFLADELSDIEAQRVWSPRQSEPRRSGVEVNFDGRWVSLPQAANDASRGASAPVATDPASVSPAEAWRLPPPANDPPPPGGTPPSSGGDAPPPEGDAATTIAPTGIGIEKLRWTQMPYYLLKNNRIPGVLGDALRRIADEIVQVPGLRMAANADGVRTQTASVEALSKQWSVQHATAVEAQDQAYYRHMGWDPAAATTGRARLRELAQAAGGLLSRGDDGPLTFSEFDRAVAEAVTTNEVPVVRGRAVPEALEAAKAWRTAYDNIERAANELGVMSTWRYRDLSRAALTRQREDGEARVGAFAGWLGVRDGWVEDSRNAREALPDAFRALIGARDDYRASKRAAARDPLREELDRAWQDYFRLRAMGQQLDGGWGDENYRAAAAQQRRVIGDLMAKWQAGTKGQKEADLERLRAVYLDLQDAVQRVEDLDGELSDLATNATRRQGVARVRKMLADQDALDRRLASIDSLPVDTEPYVTHRWNQTVLRQKRDDLVDTLTEWWSDPARGGVPEGSSWALARVRGEIATAHVMGETPSQTLERALRGHYMAQGMPPEVAAAQAAEGAAAARAIEQRELPSRWGVEARSLFGRSNPLEPLPLEDSILKAVRAARLDTRDESKLVDEIMGRFASQPEGMPSDHTQPTFARQRSIRLPTKVLAPYLDLEQRMTGLDYFRRMATAVETSRRMGDPNMRARLEGMELALLREADEGRADLAEANAQLQAIRDLRDKVQGVFMRPEDPSAYSVRTVRFLTNSAVVTQMGGAIWSNIADAGRAVMAFGFRRTLSMALESAVSNRAGWKLAGDEAKKAGAALELTNMARQRELYDIQDVGGDVARVEKWVSSAAQQMQFVNLVGPWTQMMQRFSGAMIQSDMVEYSLKIAEGRATADEITRAAALGIDAGRAARIADEWRTHAGPANGRTGSLFLANTDAWTDQQLAREFLAGLATAVDAVVTKPGAADRPNFMSAPMWQMVFLYKGFSISFTQRAIMAGMQQRDAQVLSGLMATVAITWLVQGAAGGEHDKHPILSDERLFTAVERSGVMGVIGDLNQAVEMVSANGAGLRPWLGVDPPVFAKDPHWAQRTGAVGGAAVSPWLTAMWAMTSEDAEAQQQVNAFRRLIWFNNLVWVSGGVGALSRELGSVMTEPTTYAPQASPAGFVGGGR
jgi:hypothetical protein